jgi:hypothetical protein
MKAKFIGIVLLSGGILAGCSGGSGGSASTPATATINPTNQAAVTKSALSTATQNFNSGFASSVGGVQTSTNADNDRMLFNFADFALQKMAQKQSTTASLSGAVAVPTTPCGISGTYSIDTDGTATTTGTYWKGTANNCVEFTNGPVENGTIYITGISSSATSFSATLALNFTETGTTTLSAVGGFTLTETGKGTATQINTLSGTSLVFSTSAGSFSLTGAAGTSGFNFTDTFNNNATTPVVHSNDINFAVAVTDKVTPANSFAFSALTSVGNPLVKSSAYTYLRSGQIVVTGDASTAIRVTILPASSTNLAGTSTGQLTIELSTDGGKTWGTATTKTWGTL